MPRAQISNGRSGLTQIVTRELDARIEGRELEQLADDPPLDLFSRRGARRRLVAAEAPAALATIGAH